MSTPENPSSEAAQVTGLHFDLCEKKINFLLVPSPPEIAMSWASRGSGIAEPRAVLDNASFQLLEKAAFPGSESKNPQVTISAPEGFRWHIVGERYDFQCLLALVGAPETAPRLRVRATFASEALTGEAWVLAVEPAPAE